MSRARRSAARPREADPVALAIHEALFAACADEMGVTLMRAAHSPNIKERLDHSCAVFDGRGRLIAQAAHIPVHLGSLPRAVEAALALAPFAPGDVVLLNDPWAGGTHLPDLTLVSPVFLGGRAPDFLVASRAHHADVGGAAPGSMPLARAIQEEGLRIPPVRLVRGGRMDRDLLRLVLANVRTSAERRADLEAQLGAQATGARRLRDLAAREGRAALARASRGLMAWGAAEVRARLRAFGSGTRRFADALDDDGLGHGPIPIRVAVTVRGGRLVADFGGSSAQVEGPVNTVEPVARAATVYAARVVLGRFPMNAGALAAIAVVAPEGSIVNARPPAPVAAGNVETSQRLVDVVLGALARFPGARVPAASYGTMSNLLVGGVDPRTGEPYAYYETLGGGHGAGPGWDGASAMQAHMTNTRNTPIEALEHAYPLRVHATRIRRGTGGRGRFRGGDGIERTIEVLAPARVTVVSDRRATAPWGLAGGGAGARGENRVRGPARGSRARRMPGKFQIDLGAGAVLTVASPGGGGHGRPRVRARRAAAGRS